MTITLLVLSKNNISSKDLVKKKEEIFNSEKHSINFDIISFLIVINRDN